VEHFQVQKFTSKYYGNICSAVGRAAVISMREQPSLCFLACVHFHTWGFLEHEKIFLGISMEAILENTVVACSLTHRCHYYGIIMRQLLCGQKLLILLLLLYLLSPLWRILTIIHVSETNYVSRAHSDAAVLYLQFVLHVMLLGTWNMFLTYSFCTYYYYYYYSILVY
jgi:hypothetical protein